MLNQSVLTGNLGADPEMLYSPSSGDPVARFNIAFNSGKDKTSWVKVVCFKKIAEIAEKHLHKGARIAVSGTLDENVWTNDDNQTRRTMQAICHNLEFIKTDGRGFENGQSNDTPF